MSACPSELVLDRLVVGELADSAHDGVRDHVSGCARCTGRLDERKAIAATFASDVGLEMRVAAAQRAVGGPRRRATWIAAAGAVAAAAVVLIVVVRRPQGGEEQGGTPGIRTKGGLSLGLVAKHLDGQIESVTSPATLAPGEAIELEISTKTAGFVAVVSVDAAGVVSTYAAPQRLEAGARQLLDGSIVLDETLGVERLFAVECPATFAIEPVVAAARGKLAAAGGDPARVDVIGVEGCSEASFSIRKAAR